MGKLDGRIAIVTGATSGMGRAIAELFTGEGARVVMGGRDEDRAETVLRSIAAAGGEALFVPGDVAEMDTARHLVAAAVDTWGGLDILIPNAGMLGLGSITELEPDEWHRTVAVNLHAVYYLLHNGIPELQKRGKGAIVVNGSIAAFKGFPNHAAYCASKGGLVALVKELAIDYGPSIRANLICPGPVDTPFIHDSAAAFPNSAEIVREVGEGVPLRRLGLPRDVADAALFLASDDSSWITGTSLVVDGGALSGG